MDDGIMPPAARTGLWAHVTEAAKAGAFHLQHCAVCKTVQYPPREVCGNCLSDDLVWAPVDGTAKVLSHTSLAMSVEPWFQDRLPVEVVLVRLDLGPVLYAFGDENQKTGDDVVIRPRIDAAGQAVLVAHGK